MPPGEPDAQPAPLHQAEAAGAPSPAPMPEVAAPTGLRAVASAAGNAAMTRSLSELQRARGNLGVARMLAREAAAPGGGPPMLARDTAAPQGAAPGPATSPAGGSAPGAPAGDGKQAATGLV